MIGGMGKSPRFRRADLRRVMIANRRSWRRLGRATTPPSCAARTAQRAWHWSKLTGSSSGVCRDRVMSVEAAGSAAIPCSAGDTPAARVSSRPRDQAQLVRLQEARMRGDNADAESISAALGRRHRSLVNITPVTVLAAFSENCDRGVFDAAVL